MLQSTLSSAMQTIPPAKAYLGRKKAASALVSRNITVNGHRTSVRLEPEMWGGLTDICRRERANLNEVCSAVATSKPDISSLTAAIRVFVMAYFRAATTEEGHGRAGHGRGVSQLNRPVCNQQGPHNPNLIGASITPPGQNVNLNTGTSATANIGAKAMGGAGHQSLPQPQAKPSNPVQGQEQTTTTRPVPFMIGGRLNNRQ